MSCPEPLVSTHSSSLGILSCAGTTCSRPRLCLKLPESLFFPPCSLLWSGPAWSQARNSHYCLTRKAASSAEGGNLLPGTPCSRHCQLSVVTEHLPAPPWQSAHLGE